MYLFLLLSFLFLWLMELLWCHFEFEMPKVHYIVRDLCEVEFFWEVFLEGKGARAY